MSDQRNRKTALSDNKLKLTAPKLDGGDRPPTLNVQIEYNNVHIVVWTNLPGDKFGGNLSARLDSTTFGMFLELVEQAIDAEAGWSALIENKYKPRDKKGLEVMSKLIAGKDKEGCVYISVVAPDESRPKIKFSFKPSYFHNFIHGSTREPYSDAELSILMAKAWVKNIRKLVLTTLAVDPQWRPSPGGGNNNSGGNRGKQQNRKADDDFGGGGSNDWQDDFPM